MLENNRQNNRKYKAAETDRVEELKKTMVDLCTATPCVDFLDNADGNPDGVFIRNERITILTKHNRTIKGKLCKPSSMSVEMFNEFDLFDLVVYLHYNYLFYSVRSDASGLIQHLAADSVYMWCEEPSEKTQTGEGAVDDDCL